MSLIDRLQKSIIAKRIEALKEHEVLPQGSECWLQARRVLLTGSECASFLQCTEECAAEYVAEFAVDDFKFSKRCASPYGSSKQVIKKKRGILSSDFGSVFTNWGHLFEDTIRQLWQYLNDGAEVQEYGLITSPIHTFLAASPDGVCPTGIILEFKAPYKRKIRDAKAPPFHYWIQTQILMECLCLPLTHYIEAEFTCMYPTEEVFLKDVLEEGEMKGCLIQKSPSKSITPPLAVFGHPESQLLWCKENMEPGDNLLMWKLMDYNLFEIKRNRVWFNRVLPFFKQGWNDLIHFDTAKAQLEESLKQPRSYKRKRAENDGNDQQRDTDLCGSDDESDNVVPDDLCGSDEDQPREETKQCIVSDLLGRDSDGE